MFTGFDISYVWTSEALKMGQDGFFFVRKLNLFDLYLEFYDKKFRVIYNFLHFYGRFIFFLFQILSIFGKKIQPL